MGEIEQLCNLLIEGSNKTYNDIEQIRIILINLKITIAKLQDPPEVRALNKTGDTIEEVLINFERTSKRVGEIAHKIKEINSEVNK